MSYVISDIDAPGNSAGDPRDAYRDGFVAAVSFVNGHLQQTPHSTAHALGVLKQYRAAMEAVVESRQAAGILASRPAIVRRDVPKP